MISQLIDRTLQQIRPQFDEELAAELGSRWARQPKQPASLGRLENLVVHYGLVKGSAQPVADRKGLILFAGDHGVVHEGVTTEAQDDTHRHVRQFLQGLSAASVLCRSSQIEMVVVDAGMRGDKETGAVDRRIGEGSGNFARGAALSSADTVTAMEAGIEVAEAMALRFDIVGLGQLGVGGSCAAAAMLCGYSGRDAADSVLREPGLDEATYQRRVQVIRSGVNRNQRETVTPFGILRSLGGLDIAAMTGFILGAAAVRLPVMMDGFTTCAAAAAARGFAPDALDALMFSHAGTERSHAYALHFLSVAPLLDMEIREESGFGAALALQMLDTALRLYAGIRAPA
jgi:nicotinate-nucleotide--dimethylbenzimidazole phosphoribosyltransferase